MMKSFFKKLAFVMALAMVVSLAAPAGVSALAAETYPLRVVDQKTNEVYTELALEKAGDSLDLKYWDYKGTTPWYDADTEWVSSNEDVVTVDTAGVITAVADGTATITVTIEEVWKGSVEVTVGEEEAVVTPEEPEEPAEVDGSWTTKQIASDKVTLTFTDAAQATTDVKLYKVFELTDGSTRTVAWPCEVSAKDGVVTIDAYVEFVDGELFEIVVGDNEPELFTAFIGPITDIEFTAVTVLDNKNTDATSDDVVEAEVYGGTNPIYPIRFNIKYLTASGIEVSPAANSWVIYEALELNENVYIDSTGANSFFYTVGASTVVKATYSYYDANNEIQSLTYELPLVAQAKPVAAFAGATDYAVVSATSKKATETTWGTASVIVGEGAYAAFKYADTLEKAYTFNTDNATATTFGAVSFKSSDESKLLIGDDGYMTAISEGSAVVIVQLTDSNNVKKSIYAFEVALTPARKASYIVPSDTTVSVLTKDNAGGAYTTKEVTFKVYDNYNQVWKGAAGTVSVETTAAVTANSIAVTYAAGEGKFTVNGTAYATENVSSILYTIKAATATPANVVVVPKKPAVDASGAEVVTTGYTVTATGGDLNVATVGALYANIKVKEVWAGYPIEDVTVTNFFTTADYFTKNNTGLKVNDLVIKVTKADGTLVDDVTTAGVLLANAASGAALDVKNGVGNYNVTLYTVTNVTPNTGAASGTSLIAYRQLDTATFSVENKAKQLSVKEYAGNLTNTTATDIKTAVASIVVLQGIDGFTLTSDKIVSVNGVLNTSADKCYVNSIVVKVPLGNTGCYFEQTIAINKTLTVPGVANMN